ncbi:hypothetical protein O7634_12620 [Micromonospora sp. WMMD1120]|uniref:hypothetical protein n=1 Tax=Micromonospora sp. WMMD1120 TaxID=3016106 RepID=UPI002415F525|nr:hypothetical protein [Micromonospora sp. WMMD1120]MDG4807595.1 hypothetical protein [Micromonospora sp. WMMD1120]
MSDEAKKGVQVAVPHGAGRDFHEGASDVHVGDGHLYVYRGARTNGFVVAVYAPGKWHNAQVLS